MQLKSQDDKTEIAKRFKLNAEPFQFVAQGSLYYYFLWIFRLISVTLYNNGARERV